MSNPTVDKLLGVAKANVKVELNPQGFAVGMLREILEPAFKELALKTSNTLDDAAVTLICEAGEAAIMAKLPTSIVYPPAPSLALPSA